MKTKSLEPKVFIRTDNFLRFLTYRNLSPGDLSQSLALTRQYISELTRGVYPIRPKLRVQIQALLPEAGWEDLFRLEEVVEGEDGHAENKALASSKP